MKMKFILCLILMGVLISPVLADDYKLVSITYGGEQYMSIPSTSGVIYLYTSDIPQNGVLLLSFPDNDTYMVRSENSVQMITVNKNNRGIIETILGWLGL